jgi:uncharacterized protein (DUF1800 family)
MDAAYADAAHLFRRVGFGALPEEIERYKHWAWADLVDLVLDTSRAPALPPLPDLSEGRGWYRKWVDMTWYWLDQARRPVDQAPVVEKMVLFWSGVLCSALDKVQDHPAMMEQNQAFRTLGMGSYHTLLHTISVGPAMIRYLDNDRNVLGRPNENFSRELMELFTIGVGQYTETDVVEAARAWTGHGVDKDTGAYRFDPAKHDNGTKTFLGQTGNWDGPDVLNLILGQRREAHARFMCRKLWSFFAYPVELDAPEVTDIMATYRTGLNIGDTLRAILLHPSFRSSRARWALVRSPIEYIVAVMRHSSTDCAIAHPEWAVAGMGQVPFQPPNVSGWRQNGYWINSTAAWAKFHLTSRIRFHAARRDDIATANEIVSWNPMQFRHTPEQSVDMALWNFKLGPVEPAGRQKMIDFVNTVRGSDHRWSERHGLMQMALLLPELQVA